MKKSILVILLLVVSHANAQGIFSDDRIKHGGRGGRGDIDNMLLSYGYYIGFNSLDFLFQYRTNNHEDILVKSGTGFNVGLIGNLKLGKHLDLRFEPGLTFTTRTLQYPETYSTIDLDFTDPVNSEREVKSTYVYFPLLLKVSTKRLGNFKPFIVGGVSAAINLSSNEKSDDDNFAGKFRMKSNPAFMELGFGIDFYTHYFKFTPSIRGVFAVTDELVPDKDPTSPWTSNIGSIKTRGFFINFTFQ